MTARITSGQSKQIKRFMEDGLDGLDLTKDSAQRVITQGDVLQARLKEAILALANEFFIPILDADVPEKHAPTLAKYRKLATDHGVPAKAAVCYRVRAGFTLKSHAPKAGPCYEQFRYLQDWNLPEEPTADCIVFWVPRILEGSTSKTRDEQTRILSDLRTKLELPEHHMRGLGSVGLVAGLILAHHKATGERIPLEQYWVRTDTCRADGSRLYLGDFDGAGLRCSYWYFGGSANGLVGVFALGVEALGT